MKVQELRQQISVADRGLLEKAFVECYKKMTKGQKEEADLMITSILAGEEKKDVSKAEELDFEKLDEQIMFFIENARAGNYFAPNRIIPKNQRPKWRFLVKNYIKALGGIPAESEHHTRAEQLLTALYSLMCEACNYYLFSTDDPFRSIGWGQDDLFQLVVQKTFASGYSREKISKLLLLASSGGLSRISLHVEQQMVLLSELKTSDMKYVAIEEAKALVDGKYKKLGQTKKGGSQYYIEEAISNLCIMVLLISVSLAETASGIKYYFENQKEINKEVALYIALDRIYEMEDDKAWIEIYEYGMIKEKIKPRESLVRGYQERKAKEPISK